MAEVVKKIALVVPNYRWKDYDRNTLWQFIPYSLCLIAAVIENEFDVRLIDANINDISEQDFKEIISDYNPDVVGITAMMDKYGKCAHLGAKIIKTVNQKIITVMGGVYTTTNPNKVMLDRNIDYAVVGEGEYCFRDLLYFLNDKKSQIPNGVWYKSENEVIENGMVDFIKDLDSLPLPAYGLIEYEKYGKNVFRNSVDRPPILPYARIFTSRGCTQNCVFCQVGKISGRRFRARSANNVINEIRWLKEEYGIKSFIIDDDNFFTNRKRVIEILKGLIRYKIDLPWKAIAVAAFYLNDEVLGLMKESGCQYIDLAIESGVERILKEIVMKPLKLDHALKIVKKAKNLGIDVAANFIIGFPGETWDEIRQTLKFAEEIDVDYVKIFTATPLPSTMLLDLAISTDSLLDNYNSEDIDWNRAWIETKDFRAKDLTILRAYEWDRINFTIKAKREKIASMMNITEKELLSIRRGTLDAITLKID